MATQNHKRALYFTIATTAFLVLELVAWLARFRYRLPPDQDEIVRLSLIWTHGIVFVGAAIALSLAGGPTHIRSSALIAAAAVLTSGIVDIMLAVLGVPGLLLWDHEPTAVVIWAFVELLFLSALATILAAVIGLLTHGMLAYWRSLTRG